MFNAKDTKKTNKKSIWILMLLIGILSVGIISCDDDDNNDNNAANPGSGEAESAFLLAYGVRTPEGFITYMEVAEEIPAESNIDEAIELGNLIRVTSFGENPYTWNPSNSTLTRWNIDKTTLEPTQDGLLSFVGTGIEGRPDPPFFLSETQAYFTNFTEGSIVEWNPTTMEIVGEISVEPLPLPSIELDIGREGFSYLLSDGKILFGVVLGIPAQCCEFADVPGITAVFDPAAGSIQYNTDDRMFGSESALLVDENGTRYAYTHFRFGWAEPFFNYNGEKSPGTVLRLKEDGSFDEDFFFDAAEAVPLSYAVRFGFIFDNKLQLIYVDDSYEFPASFDDRNEIFDAAVQSVFIDLDTKEVSSFTALDRFSNYVPLSNPVDDAPHFFAFEPDFEGIVLIRQDGPTDFSELTRLPGAGRVWNFSRLF